MVTCSLEITVPALYIAMLSANKGSEMKCSAAMVFSVAVSLFVYGMNFT